MPSIVTFTSGALSLQSVQLQNAITLRVRFTTAPVQLSSINANDALNPTNYSLVGPAVVYAISVSSVPSDPQSVDLNLSSFLPAGNWTLFVSGIQTPALNNLTPPTSLSFISPGFTALGPLSQGAENSDEYQNLRGSVLPAFRGRFWIAILASLARVGETLSEQARLAFNQWFLSSASGKYLDDRASDQGVQKPTGIGLSEEAWRDLAIKFSAEKITQDALYRILEIFYGSANTRAFVQSVGFSPYQLENLDDLIVKINNRTTIQIVFKTEHFRQIQAATGPEICALITTVFSANKVDAWAEIFIDPEAGTQHIRIFTGALGQKGSIQILGGKAQRKFLFSDRVFTRSTGTQVGVDLNTWVLTVPSAGTLRLILSGVTGTDLSPVQVGDYLQIQGSNFSIANRGNFTVTSVDVRYVVGVLTQVVEVANTTATAQASVVITNTNDLMFFRPVIKRLSGGTAAIISNYELGDRSFKVLLPVTTAIVSRTAGNAAYLQEDLVLAGSTITRTFNNELDITTGAAHGLTTGQLVEIEGFSPNNVNPPAFVNNASYVSAFSNVTHTITDRIIVRPGLARLSDSDKYFVVGGRKTDAPNYVNSVQFFDLTFTPEGTGGRSASSTFGTAGTLAIDTELPVVTPLLDNDRMIVTGGRLESGEATNRSYVIKSVAGTTTAGPNMNTARVGHWSVVDDYGRIVVGNGINSVASAGPSLNTVEYIDPNVFDVLSVWSNIFNTATPRAFAAATKLSNGFILIAGGHDRTGVVSQLVPELFTTNIKILSTCELYDVDSGSVFTGNMCVPRTMAKLVHIPGSPGLIAEDRVFMAGGATTGGSIKDNRVIEIWEGNTSRWRPFANMSVGRVEFTFEKIPGKNQIVIWGGRNEDGLVSNVVEILDIDTGKMKTISSKIQNPSLSNGIAGFEPGTVVSIGSGDLVNASDDYPQVYVSQLDQWSKVKGINGSIRKITSAAGSSLTLGPLPEGVVRQRAGTSFNVRPLRQVANTQFNKGPFMLDPELNHQITGTQTTTVGTLNVIDSYQKISVASVTGFSRNGGYVILGFGTDTATRPIKYLTTVPSTNQIILDGAFTFEKEIPAGTNCMYSAESKPLDIMTVFPGLFYVTDSSSGRIGAINFLLAAAPKGIYMDIDTVYPGDRGLGNEGFPVENASKLSDRVWIWGRNNYEDERRVVGAK